MYIAHRIPIQCFMMRLRSSASVLTVIVTIIIQCNHVVGDYWSERKKLLDEEKRTALGGDVILNGDEMAANELLLKAKREELTRGHLNESEFLAAQHFFRSGEEMERSSKVFAVIRRMPKGACLHTHITASASLDYVFGLTFAENLYGCVHRGIFRLHFFEEGKQADYCKWELLKDLRAKNDSFDAWLKQQLTLKVGDYDKVYPSIEDVWKKFKATFSTKYYLVSFKPVFEDYIYESLREFYRDNITYVEFRGSILPLYELTGKTYNASEYIEILQRTVQRFKSDHPRFLGVRYIYSYYRDISNNTFTNCLSEYLALKKRFPAFIAGFDLIGYEDKARPLQSFAYEIQKRNGDLKLFLHAAETKWYGFTSDLNLVDALLLNASRIAHALALPKHPEIAGLIKQRGIAVEITPISNQILMFVHEFRNHPAAGLIAQGFPVVIGNDDPGVWGACGVSYDWYVVFMAMTSEDAGLEVLKKLAMNSFVYSSMEDGEKAAALLAFEDQWRDFVGELGMMR